FYAVTEGGARRHTGCLVRNLCEAETAADGAIALRGEAGFRLRRRFGDRRRHAASAEVNPELIGGWIEGPADAARRRLTRDCSRRRWRLALRRWCHWASRNADDRPGNGD